MAIQRAVMDGVSKDNPALESGNLATIVVLLQQNIDLLKQTVTELQVQNELLVSGLNINAELSTYRNDPAYKIN